MNTQLNFALRETLSLSKYVMLLALFIYFIFFCLNVIIYIINNAEAIGAVNTTISLILMSYSIGGLIICMVSISEIILLERQYR